MPNNNASHYQDFTNLDQWLYYLENLHSTEIDLGLTRIQQVAARLAIDLSFATVITVAGTNGKGTTCAFLENALLAQKSHNFKRHNFNNSDRTVAVYSSPHIENFNERLRINKIDVTDQPLIEAFNKIEAARGEISLSYYEYTTLAAFMVLMAVKPDFIILEVGLGGRLDATNLIDADVAVITTIDLDHQAFLGNDRETIGFEKAGIMRAEQLIIIGDTNAPKSVLDHAYRVLANKTTNLHIRNKDFHIIDNENKGHEKQVDDSLWAWQATQDTTRLLSQLNPAFIPCDNVATALMVLTSLGMLLERDFVNIIIEQTKVAGRTELFTQENNCDVILDVGHNPQACRYLASHLQRLNQLGKYRKIHAVVAMLGDKDVSNSLSALSDEIDHWYIGQLPIPRAATTEVMAQHLTHHLSQKDILASNRINCFDNVTDAFKIANQNAGPNDLLLVFGSFYTVAEVRALLLPK